MKISVQLERYKREWIAQDAFFSEAGERNPYIKPELIIESKLTAAELTEILKLEQQSDSQLLFQVNDLLKDKYSQLNQEVISLEEARKKIGFSPVRYIPMKDTCTLEDLCYSPPSSLTDFDKKIPEVIWLYKQGYIPHLYWNNGEPRFHYNMWFIIDFVIRYAELENGWGFSHPYNKWRPNWMLLSNCVRITEYMYNSWDLGIKVMAYAKGKKEELNLKGESGYQFERSLRDSIWTNEGSVLAKELFQIPFFGEMNQLMVGHFRDKFALLAFDAFPLHYIMDLFENPIQRMAASHTTGNLSLAVYNMDIANVNTYKQKELQERYELLFSAADWAYSMLLKRKSDSLLDTVQQYSYFQKSGSGEIPCRICGKPFKPKRPSFEVTCGSKECIKKNKYLSKKRNKIDTPLVAG